jgi:hypothetical protein
VSSEIPIGFRRPVASLDEEIFLLAEGRRERVGLFGLLARMPVIV